MDQCEGRAADFRGIDPKAFRQTAYERRLPGAEVTGQQQHVAGVERRGQFPGDGLCFVLGSRYTVGHHEAPATN
jgi:hypothetical protein